MKSQKKPNAPFSRIMNIIFSDFRCWEVNDVHFEVAIRTQFPPCDVPWWFRHACFHRHCNMNMNERENSLFWPETCLLRRKKFHHRSPPHTHSVWSGALIKQKKKKEHFYISNLLHFQKPHCLWATPCTGAGRQRIAQGEMTQLTNGWWGICSAWKPIITGK